MYLQVHKKYKSDFNEIQHYKLSMENGDIHK